MTPEKVLDVIEIYQRKFDEMSVKRISYSHDDTLEDPDQAIEHCHGMLATVVRLIGTGQAIEAERWLGFVQGCLWQSGVYTLEELNNHNQM